MSKLDDQLNDLIKVASGIVVSPHYTKDYCKQEVKNLILELMLESYDELGKLPKTWEFSKKLRDKVAEL